MRLNGEEEPMLGGQRPFIIHSDDTFIEHLSVRNYLLQALGVLVKETDSKPLHKICVYWTLIRDLKTGVPTVAQW